MKNRSVFVFFLTLLLAFFVVKSANADVIDPKLFEKKCDPGEMQVTCTYFSEDPYGPRIRDGCKKYELNESYRYLTSRGSFVGGEEVYCTSGPVKHYSYLVLLVMPVFLLTLLFEFPVLAYFGFEWKNNAFLIIFANLVTVGFLNLTISLAPTGAAPTLILVLEAIIVLLEALIYKRFIDYIKPGKIFLASLMANLLSGIVGTLIMTLIY